MFTFKKWNENETKGFQLDAAVSAKIESKSIIFFDSGVPTLADVATAATNEIYILAEDLVPSTTKDNVMGQKDTAVVYPIRDEDVLVAPYRYVTDTGTAPVVGAEVSVDGGVELAETGDGEVSRFKIEEVLTTSYEDGTDTVTYVAVKLI